jgi:nitric oxide reductase NorD protein
MTTDFSAVEGLEAVRGSVSHYLRALLGHEVSLLTCESSLGQQRTYLSDLGLHLPRCYFSYSGSELRTLYFAAAAHAAAHLAYSTMRFERKSLKPLQLAIIGLLEDARIEALAIQEMPGLRRIWLQFFEPGGRDSNSADALLLRLSRVLLDPQREDSDPWVMKAQRWYHASQQEGSNPAVLRELGSVLGNDLGQMRVQFNARTYMIEPVYRDDNLFMWTSETPPEENYIHEGGFSGNEHAQQSIDTFDEHAEQETRFRPREIAGATQSTHDNSELPRYPEWDTRIGRYRERWCSIIEEKPTPCDASALKARVAAHAELSSQLTRLLHARKLRQPHRLRRQIEGEELELDTLVRAMGDLRSGLLPDMRVHRRRRQQKPDLSILLLLDLSASTNVALSSSTLLSLICEASVLLGVAIDDGGDQLAIHGFRSNGRHQVNYLRFKEFGEAMDDAVLGRLSGVSGALSTRMGAAIRHASYLMRKCRTAQRLILVLTDGEPHDIDVFDPSLLVWDAARAVERSTSEGTPVFCVSVDPQAELYLKKIFGPHNYQVIDRITQLPQRLPQLYLRLMA